MKELGWEDGRWKRTFPLGDQEGALEWWNLNWALVDRWKIRGPQMKQKGQSKAAVGGEDGRVTHHSHLAAGKSRGSS